MFIYEYFPILSKGSYTPVTYFSSQGEKALLPSTNSRVFIYTFESSAYAS